MSAGIISRWRRKLAWTPVAVAILFVVVSIVQMEGGSDTTRILIMCTDLRGPLITSGPADKISHYRSDIMLIVEIREKEKRIVVTQVPRDTMAYICPELGLDKVNSSVFLAGARESRDVVGKLMGNEIQHYIVLSVPESLQFVKIIGGITIPTDSGGGLTSGDPKSVSSDQNGQKSILLKDQAALDYVMIRPGSDVEREKNQQQFLKALIKQCRKLNAEQVCRLALWAWNQDGDMSPVQMARYGRLFLRSDREFRSLDTSALYLNGTSYLLAVKQDQSP